ncbi:MAG: tetratricopeptide repeat protein [Candidatus Brocadiia bacterium]
MKYALAVSWLFILSLVCYGEVSEAEQRIIDRLSTASVPDKEIDLAETSLIIASTVYSDIDTKKYLAKIDEMAQDIRNSLKTELRGKSEQESIILAINKYLYKNIKIHAESVIQENSNTGKPIEINRDKFLLNKVLDNLNGNCLGLTTLYWCLAERLNLPLRAVVIPQHVFLRYYSGEVSYRNIEPTSNGAEISNENYEKKTRETVSEELKYSFPVKMRFKEFSKEEFIGLILYNRGVDYLKKRNADKEAMDDFSNAIKLAPGFADSYKNRGVGYIKTGEYIDAAKDLRQAVRLESDCPINLFNLGVAYLNLEEYAEARKNFDLVSELAPDYIDAYLNRGVASYKLQQFDQALNDFESVITIKAKEKIEKENLSKAYYYSGLIYFNMKRYPEAISYYDKALEIKQSCDMFHNRGIAYAMLLKYGEAAADMERALESASGKSPKEYADILRNLGVTYYKLSNYQRSMDALEKYLKLMPDDKEVQVMVDSLSERLK